MKFTEVTNSALESRHVENDWFNENPALRFANNVVAYNEWFSENVAKYGHWYLFEGDSIEKTEDKIEVDRLLDITMPADVLPDGVDTVDCSYEDGVMEWLGKTYQDSRGFELGTFNGSLLAQAMKKQSDKWEPIALGYIRTIIRMTHQFIEELFALICPDDRIREGLMSMLMEELTEKYCKATSQVQFILRVERQGTPATMNHYFNDNLEKRQVYHRLTSPHLLTGIAAKKD